MRKLAIMSASAMLMVIFVSGCTVPAGNPTVCEILSSPAAYAGRLVELEGRYGGWGQIQEETTCQAVSGMKTRSDAQFCDDTGCIYGSWETLTKSAYVVGDTIRIRAEIEVIEGKAVLSRPESSELRIESFEECVSAGFPVMESQPRQCSTPSGMTYTEAE